MARLRRGSLSARVMEATSPEAAAGATLGYALVAMKAVQSSATPATRPFALMFIRLSAF